MLENSWKCIHIHIRRIQIHAQSETLFKKLPLLLPYVGWLPLLSLSFILRPWASRFGGRFPLALWSFSWCPLPLGLWPLGGEIVSFSMLLTLVWPAGLGCGASNNFFQVLLHRILFKYSWRSLPMRALLGTHACNGCYWDPSSSNLSRENNENTC